MTAKRALAACAFACFVLCAFGTTAFGGLALLPLGFAFLTVAVAL